MPLPGWHFWNGAAFSLVYFALALIHFIAGGEKSARLRAVSLLAGGLVAFILVFILAQSPPGIAANDNGPLVWVAQILPGLVLAGALALLTTIIGAVQLRHFFCK